jgi:hypothetical protein
MGRSDFACLSPRDSVAAASPFDSFRARVITAPSLGIETAIARRAGAKEGLVHQTSTPRTAVLRLAAAVIWRLFIQPHAHNVGR